LIKYYWINERKITCITYKYENIIKTDSILTLIEQKDLFESIKYIIKVRFYSSLALTLKYYL